MRTGKLRLLALSIITAGAIIATPGIAAAGSDQSCSQRGGKNNTVTCKSLITVGDINVTLTGNRILSDFEVNTLTNNIILVNGVCNATGKNNQACTVDILNVVVDITKSFNNYSLLSVLVTKGSGKGGGKSSKSCPC